MATIFDPQEEEKKKSTQAPTGAQGQPLQTVGTATTQPRSGMASPEKRPQGSGRFTNLQKYIEANKGAGQKIAGQVGQKVGGQLGEQQEKAKDYYGKLGQSISQAQQTAGQGVGYLEQLRTMGQQFRQPEGSTAQDIASQQVGAQQFTSDPAFQNYQNFAAGRGIDEATLAANQARAAQQASQFLGGAQKAQQALGTETGRFDLLRQTYGGEVRPSYTTGQQRLDQLFLTSGGGLGDLRQDVSGRLKAAQDLSKQMGGTATDVRNLAAQEQGLMADIQSEATGLTSTYQDLLNKQLAEKTATGDERYKNIQDMLASGQITQEEASKLGLEVGMRTYGLDLDDYIEGPTGLSGQWSTATPEQLERYRALQQIAGQEQQGDPTELGSYTGPSISDRFAADIKAKEQERQTLEGQLASAYRDLGQYTPYAQIAPKWQDMSKSGDPASQIRNTMDNYRKQMTQHVAHKHYTDKAMRDDNIVREINNIINEQKKSAGDRYPDTSITEIQNYIKKMNLNDILNMGAKHGRTSSDRLKYESGLNPATQATMFDRWAAARDARQTVSGDGPHGSATIDQSDLNARKAYTRIMNEYLGGLEGLNLTDTLGAYQAPGTETPKKWSEAPTTDELKGFKK